MSNYNSFSKEFLKNVSDSIEIRKGTKPIIYHLNNNSMKTKNVKLCIDFDGTCVTHKFPEIGEDIGAVPVLRELVDHGHKLILCTMRSDGQTKYPTNLTEALEWFKENDITLYGINADPSQKHWTNSPKPFAELYIDDAGLGIPLITGIDDRPYVDWISVRAILMDKGLLPALEVSDSRFGGAQDFNTNE